MASDDKPPDSDSALLNQPLTSGVASISKHAQKSKKRIDHFYYVSAESTEADTLKDKFWRDLDQGKMPFDNTEDLYTRVKRGAKKTSTGLRLNITRQQDIVGGSVETIIADNSTGCCIADGGYISGGTTVPDASTPASSGYDSSSIPSVGPVTAANSPADAALSHFVPASLTDLRFKVEDDTSKRATLCSKKKRPGLKKSYYTSAGRTALHKSKKRRKSFYELVDASSAEADTLKDKFWRDLDMGKVKVATTTDLYSSVKVSRSNRPRAVSILSGRSASELSFSKANGAVTEDLTWHHDRIRVELDTTDDAFINPNSSHIDSDVKLKVEVTDATVTAHCRMLVDVVDQRPIVVDTKLQSPCAVSVERLPRTYSTGGSQVSDTECSTGSEKIKHYLNFDGNHRQRVHTASCTVQNPKIEQSEVTKKRSRFRRLPRRKRRHVLERQPVDRAAAAASPEQHLSSDTCTTRNLVDWSSAIETEVENTLPNLVDDNEHDSVLLFCTDPEKPCNSCCSFSSWVKSDKEPVCIQSRGTLRQFIEHGDCSSVRLLLCHRSLPIVDMLHAVDTDDRTLLMLAASLGHCDIVDLLVQNGADINQQSKNGSTALMNASERGLKRVVERLLALGAHMELRTNLGETVLMKAVRDGHYDIVELLLSNGVNTAAVSESRETASIIARRCLSLEHICNLLDSHVTRRRNALHDAVRDAVCDLVNIVDALFPLHCVAVHEVQDRFALRFRYSQHMAPNVVKPVLFVGHSLMGEQHVVCRLHGVSSITAVYLNGIQLSPLDQEQFMYICEPLIDNNELVLHVNHTTQHQREKLLVCAYFIEPNLNKCQTIDCTKTVADISLLS